MGLKRKQRRWLLLSLILIIAFFSIWLMVPHPLIDAPFSTVVEDTNGKLLGAKIADDGQWRFPEPDSIPVKFEACLLTFEDKHFYKHPGINPVSIVRALVQNIRNGEIVSGGSTLTMQLCRIARQGKQRNYYNKVVEMLWALNLEMRFSKKEILTKYAANAPFGGNVVGLDAASWRYFNRPAFQLSWAEAATLAVLPNAPSLIYPGKRDQQLLLKRNRLLKSLLSEKKIDSISYELALIEPLPEKVYRLPGSSYHLVQRAYAEKRGERIRATINKGLQEKAVSITKKHGRRLMANHVNNLAAIVVEIKSGDVLAYVGNNMGLAGNENGRHVDIVTAPRSTGSILKPLLYAAMVQDGQLAPGMLIPDIPTRIGGFSPTNFDRKYDGVIFAKS